MQALELHKSHFDLVVKAILERRVIPFLGAGASLCDRDESEWDPGQSQHLPSTGELTDLLASLFAYPAGETKELTRVSQYAAVMEGLGPLYETLQDIFDRDYQPTSLHQFLASLPSLLRRKGLYHSNNPVRQRLVIVTTNYDDLLERAFNQQNEPYHKLVYMAEMGEGNSGSFLHATPDGQLFQIKVANEYGRLEEYERSQKLERYPVIIKIHGAVDRTHPPDPDDPTPLNPSYVITEDHYIDYLTRSDISNLLPKSIVATLKKNHYLFLGYSLRDWNLRVILRRIWREQKLDYKSWAIQLKTSLLDEKYWNSRGVEIINMDVGEYIRELTSILE